MKDKISVIIPAYNAAAYLAKCLESVLAQTYQNYEVIVVDDGSSDDTAAILDDYASRYPQVVALHQENSGVTCARMNGLKAASGDWITFVDSDDWVEPHGLQTLIGNALAYRADISHYGSQRNLPDGRVYYYYNTGRVLYREGLQGCRDLLEGSFIEPGLWNKLYKKELFAGLDTWLDASIKINEDLLVNYYLFKRAKNTIFEDICPYHYIVHAGSASTVPLNSHQLWDPLKVLRIIMQDCPDACRGALYERMVRCLIAGAILPYGENETLIAPYRKETRTDLRQRLPQILSEKECSRKLKVMALWTAIWPTSYGCVHRIYEKLSGVRKKYEM